MQDRAKFLFEGTSAYELARYLQTRAMERLRAQSEDAILGTTTDDLIAEVLAAHTPDIPELYDSDTSLEEREVTRTVPLRGYDYFSDQYGGTRTVTSHIVSFHVPFDGDGGLFDIAPSNRSIPGPAAAGCSGKELVIKIATNGKTQEQVRQEYDSQIQSIKRHLSASALSSRTTLCAATG